MKLFFYKRKVALALALCMSLGSTTAFAKEPVALSAAEQGVKEAVTIVEEEEPLPILTEEEALKKARRHDKQLRDLQAAEEYNQAHKENLWDSYGYFELPTNYSYKKWIDDSWKNALGDMLSVQNELEGNRYSTEVAEIGLQLSVKYGFTSIILSQDRIRLQQEAIEMQEIILKQCQTKYELGLISKQALEDEENNLIQAKNGLSQQIGEYEELCISLNKLMGVNADTRFEYVYDVNAYAPYVMTRTMDQYITDCLNHSANLKNYELRLQIAEFSYYNRTVSDSEPEYSLEYNLSNAQRELKDMKEKLAFSIRKTYLEIQKLESNYEAALSNLEAAKMDYRAAQVKFQAGTATELAVKQAENNLMSAENELKTIIINHEMQVFTFENPDLM